MLGDIGDYASGAEDEPAAFRLLNGIFRLFLDLNRSARNESFLSETSTCHSTEETLCFSQ